MGQVTATFLRAPALGDEGAGGTKPPRLHLDLRVQGRARGLADVFGKGLLCGIFTMVTGRTIQPLQHQNFQVCSARRYGHQLRLVLGGARTAFPHEDLVPTGALLSGRLWASQQITRSAGEGGWGQERDRNPCTYLDPHQDWRSHCQTILVNMNSTLSPTRKMRDCGHSSGRGPAAPDPENLQGKEKRPLPQPRAALRIQLAQVLSKMEGEDMTIAQNGPEVAILRTHQQKQAA